MTPDQEYLRELDVFNAAKAQNEDERQFQIAREQSVVQQPYARENGLATWSAVQSVAGPILPPWGTRRREQVLRLWDRHEYNTLWQGAVAGLSSRIAATNWAVEGGKILANKYQRILWNATVGELVGYDYWIRAVFRDFMRFDGGAWIEVVGPGDPRSELIGGITGLNLLDSYTTWPTGDPEYPCVYFSRLGKYNLMHRSRVIHLVDMPDADILNPGYGLCALSRSIAVVERQMYEQRYIAMNLNDIPSSGVVIAENVTPEQVKQAYNTMEQRVRNDEPGQPGNVVWIHALNPAFPANLRNFTFSRPPEKFDWDTYVRIDVNMMALAIGEDPQDLWPLSSSAMGSGAQSEILAKKGKGKTYGHFLALIEREINGILPEALEFKFKIVDPDEAKKEADVALAWAQALVQVGERMSFDEGRRLLADNVEAIMNVVTDGSGEMVELPSTDVRPVDAPQIAPVGTPAAAPSTEPAPVVATDNTTNASTKALEDIQTAFERRFNELQAKARKAKAERELQRRRFEVLLLGLITTYGLKSLLNGLSEGGVQTDTLSAIEQAAYTQMVAEQRQYVKAYAETLYTSGISDAEAANKAGQWFNKSILPFQYYGLERADADGFYQFEGEDGVESCRDCRRLKGVKMRMSEWTRTKQRPGVDTENFQCRGYECRHTLRRVSDGKAYGAKGLETDAQRRWFFAHLSGASGGTVGMLQTLEGKVPRDIGNPGKTGESLNKFLQGSNGPLSYAMADPNIGMLKIDYDTDKFSINREVVRREAAAFVHESQNTQYSKEYLLKLARERASDNGVALSDSEVEKAFNQQYATRAQAIQHLSRIGGVRLTPAQEQRLESAASGHYLDMVYSRGTSERGTLTPVAPPRNRGRGGLKGAALQEARQNFREWVTIGS